MPEREFFDHYALLRRDDGSLLELGRGAMGITYKAFDTNLRRHVALKVINASLAHGDSIQEHLVSEARLAAGLRHHHVASVFHLGMADGSYYYVMEFIEGETVESLVARVGRLHPLLAFRIAEQVARALNAAQKHQLVHRDIKPSNLMLVQEDDELVVKVIDFGLAQLSGAMNGGFAGTVNFASPEQIESKPLDVRSDIYSLGITLWHMLAGRTPFRGSAAAIREQRSSEPLPISQLKNAPPEVIAMVRMMIETDPAARPQTPAELRKLLETAIESLSQYPADAFGGFTREGAPTPADAPESKGPHAEAGALLGGNFQIGEELGEGRLGRMFRGIDVATGAGIRIIALAPEIVSRAGARAEIERELQKAQAAPHANLVRILALEHSGTSQFIVSQWLNGFSLLDLLRARRKLDIQEALMLLRQAAAGAEEAVRHHLPWLDFSLDQIRFDFPGAPLSESDASTRLRLPVNEWPNFELKLFPAAIPIEISALATWLGDRTVIADMVARNSSAAEMPLPTRYVNSLSTVFFELLGGNTGNLAKPGSEAPGFSRYVPLAALAEEGNEILNRGLFSPESFAGPGEFQQSMQRIEGPAEPVLSGDLGSLIVLRCESCGQKLETDASAAGTVCECPICGKSLRIPEAAIDNLAATVQSRKQRSSPMPRILLVEDNEMNRDMLSRRLVRRGYDLAIAVDGGEGLRAAQSETFDLILLDLSLPVMTGWEVAAKLKSAPETRGMPIIALTAYAMASDEQKAREAGCDDFDTKPVDLPRLLGKMEALLAKSKTA